MFQNNQNRMRFLTGLIFVMVTIMLTGWGKQAQSQDKYPTRAIDIISPISPGGSSDLTARTVAAYMNKKWGIPVNVINKPGGNSVLGCLDVYRAPADGYTLLGDSFAFSTMQAVALKNLPFKVLDRTQIAVINVVYQLLFVGLKSPYKSLKDLVADIRTDPGNFTWSSLGGAGPQDLAVRQLCKAIGVDILKTKPVMTTGGVGPGALVGGGHVKLGAGAPISAMPIIKAGEIRALATTGLDRDPLLPDVPTTAELGYPTVNARHWSGLSGPPNLPSHIVHKLEEVVEEMLKDPEYISRIKKFGTMPFFHNAVSTKEFVMKEIEEVKKVWTLE